MTTFSDEMDRYLTPPDDRQEPLSAQEKEDLADDEGNRLHEWRSEDKDEELNQWEQYVENVEGGLEL